MRDGQAREFRVKESRRLIGRQGHDMGSERQAFHRQLGVDAHDTTSNRANKNLRSPGLQSRQSSIKQSCRQVLVSTPHWPFDFDFQASVGRKAALNLGVDRAHKPGGALAYSL